MRIQASYHLGAGGERSSCRYLIVHRRDKSNKVGLQDADSEYGFLYMYTACMFCQ